MNLGDILKLSNTYRIADDAAGALGAHEGSWGTREFGIGEALQKVFFPNTAVDPNTGGSQLNPFSGGTTQVAPNDINNISGTERQWQSNVGTTGGYGEEGRDIVEQLTKDSKDSIAESQPQQKQPQPQNNDQGINLKDRNSDPGPGYFWDSADGWKLVGGGGDEASRQEEARRQFEALVARSQDAYNEATKRSQYGMNRAQGIYDKGMGMLGDRRNEFKDTYATGQNDILNSYEGERGNLQASSQGAQQRNANAFRAMGITGGSGVMNYQGRLRQEQAKQQGNLGTQKQINELANQNALGERNKWADTQEGSLQTSLNDASENQRATDALASLVQQGDIDTINRESSNYFNNIQAHQQALAAANQGTKGYQANPYNVNISDYSNQIGENLPSVGSVGGYSNPTGNANTGVNINSQDPTYRSMLEQEKKKRAGVYGGGLYA